MAARIVFTSDIDHFTSFKINMAGDFLEMTIVFLKRSLFVYLSNRLVLFCSSNFRPIEQMTLRNSLKFYIAYAKTLFFVCPNQSYPCTHTYTHTLIAKHSLKLLHFQSQHITLQMSFSKVKQSYSLIHTHTYTKHSKAHKHTHALKHPDRHKYLYSFPLLLLTYLGICVCKCVLL